MQGDLNARTSNANDSAKHDKYDIVIDTENFDLPPRNSADAELNSKGKELLDLCKTFNLCIINGRKTGDHTGNFTSFQPGGSSVIDYAIASQSLFKNILTFKVGAFKPWISDHCPIHYNIDIGKIDEVDNDSEAKEKPLSTRWFWDEKSREKFEAYLKNDENQKKVSKITSSSDGDTMAADLNTLMTNIADTCGIKKKKRQDTNRQNSAPWFDKECHILKRKISQTANSLQKQPQDTSLRETLSLLKRK